MRTTKIARGAIGLELLLAVATGAAAQAPRDLARQHLESGIQFYEQQRYNQALNDFQIIVTSMADSDYADDALLRIGRYYLEVEEDFDRAKENFDSVLRGYPTGDAAPGAYYFLGEVTRRSDRSGRSLDDALANFQRVFLYPQNPWIPAALYSSGLALERQGKFQEAVDVFSQVVVEHGGAATAAGAQLGVGRSSVRLGQPLEAMAAFQEVRNDYPESPEAEEALDWLTLLFRFYGSSLVGRPVSYRRDTSFTPQLADKFKDVKALRLSGAGIHLLERGRKRVLTFDRSGKLAGSQSTVNPYGLFVDPRDALVVANEKGLVVGGQPLIFTIAGDKGPQQLEKIRTAARDRLGDIFVYDEKQKKVLRFDSEVKLIGPFPDSSRREVLKIEVDRAGNILLLDEEDRGVSVYSPEGRVVAKIPKTGSQWSLKKPSDIAIDPAGYLYILDEEPPQVAVFDAAYQFVILLTNESLASGSVRKATSLDVDASGDLYVYDEKAQAILRLR